MAVSQIYPSSDFTFFNTSYFPTASGPDFEYNENNNTISLGSLSANGVKSDFLRIKVIKNLYSKFSNITEIQFRGQIRAKRSGSIWGASSPEGKIYPAYYTSNNSVELFPDESLSLSDSWTDIKFDITDTNSLQSLIRYSDSEQDYVISPGFSLTNSSSIRSQDYEIRNLTIKIYYQKPWYSLSVYSTYGTFEVVKVSDNNNIVYNGNYYSYKEEFPEYLYYKITAIPKDGWKFDYWSQTGDDKVTTQKTLNIIQTLNVDPFDIKAFKTDYTYYPIFSFEGYTLNLSYYCDGGGDFGRVYLEDKKYNNDSAEIVIELYEGYQIKTIKIDNELQKDPDLTYQDDGIVIYTIPKIDKSINVEIVFEPIILTITPIEAENGSISPNTEQKINYNNNFEFTFQPKTGYILKDIKINNQLINWSQNYLTYQFKNVKQDYTIEPIFAKQIQLSPKSNQILYLGAKNNIQIKIL